MFLDVELDDVCELDDNEDDLFLATDDRICVHRLPLSLLLVLVILVVLLSWCIIVNGDGCAASIVIRGNGWFRMSGSKGDGLPLPTDTSSVA